MMRRPSNTPAVLAYHEVMPASNYSYCVTEDAFAAHLAVLSNSPGDVRVTFDDGEHSQLRFAAPLLARHGIKATYFVTPGLIGMADKFLSWDQLTQLQSEGHSVQSHGWSHKFLTFCGDQELVHELQASKVTLEDKLGSAVDEISIPGGRWDERVLRACAGAGYRRVYVSEPWIETSRCGVQVVGRFMVRRNTTIADLEKVVKRDARILRSMRRRARIRSGLVRVLGDDRYHRLWRALTGYNGFEETRAKVASALVPERKEVR